MLTPSRSQGDLPPSGYGETVAVLDGYAAAPAIPPVLFQTWKSRVQVPVHYAHWRRSFQAALPDWTHILWDDADNRAFIADRFPWFLEIYDAYPEEIFRADIVRYFFLFEFGGLYADMDTECLCAPGASLGRGDIVLGRMGRRRDFEHGLPNAVMASRSGERFWLFVIATAMTRARSHLEGGTPWAVEKATGPVLLRDSYRLYADATEDEITARIALVRQALSDRQAARIRTGRMAILPPTAWFPLDWTNPVHRRLMRRMKEMQRVLPSSEVRSLFPDAEMVSYWTHSWGAAEPSDLEDRTPS